MVAITTKRLAEHPTHIRHLAPSLHMPAGSAVEQPSSGLRVGLRLGNRLIGTP
ncbi:hypothetical protein D3C85_703890 [compost metagenome]